MNSKSYKPRHPTYRWECRTCDEWETTEDGLLVARRHARGHSKDYAHIVLILQVIEKLFPVKEATA